MIGKFSGKNYKAFDEFDLEIKPITILLGANSCGKSSIINAILMLSQTADSVGNSESPLKINGDKVGMGDMLNIFKNKNHLKNTSFSIELEPAGIKRTRESMLSLKRDTIETLKYSTMYAVNNIKKLGVDRNVFMEKLIPFEKMDVEEMKGAIRDIITQVRKDEKNFAPKEKSASSIEKPAVVKNIESFLTNCSLPKVDDFFTILSDWNTTKLSIHKITYEFKYLKRSNKIQISTFSCKNKNDEVIIEIQNKSNKIELKSDVIGTEIIKRSKSDLLPMLSLERFTLNKDSKTDPLKRSYGLFQASNNPVTFIISQIIRICTNTITEKISGLSVNHVSPLRAFPQRYYLLDKSAQHSKLNALDGSELAEILKNRPDIKDKINILLAQFNIAVDVENVNDIIHKIVINQDSVNLELTDVGFGISQVLPILVQAYLSPAGSLTIIEQPEIHLHPKMQAWLTDAIISIAINEDKKFIIETHSDTLIRRIRLRVVDSNSQLDDEHVAIYNVERDNNKKSSILNKINFSSDGDLIWPKGFMDTEINDTVLIEQLKYQRKIKERGNSDA